MENNITTSVPELIAKSGVVIAGLDEYGATIGLVRHTAASVTLKLTDTVMAVSGYTEKRGAERVARLALRSVARTVRIFAMQVRDSLKPTLGNIHSPAWNEVGFSKMSVSLEPAKLKALMLDIKAYLTRNPAAENVAANITAVRAQALHDQLVAAIDAVAAATYNTAAALTTRRTAANALRVTLRGVLNEMNEELDPLSDYWIRFGFNKPGADERPNKPLNLIAVLVGPTSAALKWDRAARAERYRIYKKVAGVDTEFVLVESREDLDFVLGGLPSGKSIQIAVSAVNNGGESELSAVVTVVTP